MLLELAVTDLGVIGQLSLVLGPGVTAVTGETGAGKTMVVEALGLLLGGRADPDLVRAGADEAVVEGRFTDVGDHEVVLRRVVPVTGRSRAYVNGRLASSAELAELGGRLVDLHGQHGHQSLFAPATQRDALDRFGAVDLTRLHAARRALTDAEAGLAELGGDDRTRAREVDLLRYQVAELEAAALTSPDEDRELEATEDALADAAAHREAAEAAAACLSGDAGAVDAVGMARAALAGRAPFAEETARLDGLLAELDDVARSIRSGGEAIVDDPEQLAAVRSRRQLLRDLCRKYGDTLADVMRYHADAERRLFDLERHEVLARELGDTCRAARAELAAARDEVRQARFTAAPHLAAAIESRMGDLAMPNARIGCTVDGDDGGQVTICLAAHSGVPLLPLAKAASGGELARAMLALRLELSEGPPTLVFDEVDAGIGGAAALAVGRALARLGRDHQVLVVTHLPQVAAHADHQVAVVKHDDGVTTTTTVQVLDDDARVVELSRMLSGRPGSRAARTHAEDLLAEAARSRH